MTILQLTNSAPFFETQDIYGKPISTTQYQGSWLLISFYRFATCPLCNLRLAYMMQHFPKYQDRLNVIGIFESPAHYIQEYITRKKPPFPLIGDDTGEIYKLYGVQKSWLKTLRTLFFNMPKIITALRVMDYKYTNSGGHAHRIPADFLIAANGRLELVYYGKDIADHIPIKLINQTIGIKN